MRTAEEIAKDHAHTNGTIYQAMISAIKVAQVEALMWAVDKDREEIVEWMSQSSQETSLRCSQR